jgi:hypothetical protein
MGHVLVTTFLCIRGGGSLRWIGAFLIAATAFSCTPRPKVAPEAIPTAAAAAAKSADSGPAGDPLKGATFIATTEDGRRVQMRIENVELDPQDAKKEIYLYTIFYLDQADSTWKNLCEPDLNGIAKAIPLAVYWGTQKGGHSPMTFACTVGVLAKCIRWGYSPWKTFRGVSLQRYHQACTRMARADYCGNGASHTRDGTHINVYDDLGIQHRTEEMVFEAAWDENGATYINHPRWLKSLDDLVKECPEKLAGRVNRSGKPKSIEEIRKAWPSSILFNDSMVRRSAAE